MPFQANRWLCGACLALLLGVFCYLAWPQRFYDDDAFITFRYARHLADGAGFVWNRLDGEPVEGSTSLAWTGLSALALRAGIDPVHSSWALSLAAGLAGLILVYRTARERLGLGAATALACVGWLALHRQWQLWSVAAQELRSASVLWLVATLALSAECLRRGSRRSGLGSGGWFLLGTFFRPETPLLHLGAGLGLLAARPGRATLLRLARSGLVHALGLALLIAARVAYFGQPLPNTFYAKVGGVQLQRGLGYVFEFLRQSQGFVWAPLLALGLCVALRRREPLLLALAAQAALFAAWVVVEGGATSEFRFLDPLLPAITLLLGCALTSVRERSSQLAAAALGLALLATQIGALRTPFHGFRNTASAPHLKATADFLLEQGRALAPYLGPEDRIASGWAGALPYVTDAWHLDTYGLNDPVIARRPFQRERALYHQRHATWDDVVARRVMFCDVFNRFLFPEPLAPELLRHAPEPWARRGIPMYCVRLPEGRFRYWIFASARPDPEVRSWLAARGLELVYQQPLELDP